MLDVFFSLEISFGELRGGLKSYLKSKLMCTKFVTYTINTLLKLQNTVSLKYILLFSYLK